MDTVIDTYGKSRLLTFDRDPITRGPTVEVAHEALLRAWGRLRQWLDANPGDELWPQLRAELDRAPSEHLLARGHLGWGVFALMAR